MIKTVVAATSLAVLGTAGVGTVAGHDAHAATQGQVNYADLAEKALNNPQSLNQAPVHSGSYDYNFNYNGNQFHFWSNGTNFGWNYNGGVQSSQSAPGSVKAVQYQAPSQSYTQDTVKQQPVQQTSNYQAPQRQAAPQQASSGSMNIPAHLQLIAQRESGGNIHAINPSSGAAGKYQFMQTTWDSVAPAGWAGKSPASAPEYIQDQAAIALYNGGAGAGHWVTA